MGLPDNVVLVGFMGAGKSAVGRRLAKRLDRCFVETDDMIVAKEGRSIPEIFAERGEAYFRALEAEVLELLRLKHGEVIATGGGLPCRPGAMEALRMLGTVVWLTADFDTLYRRASQAGGRPMLESRSRGEVVALLREREAHYRRAHLSVDTTDLGVDGVVNRILVLLGEHSELAPRG
jgi:shikimate kinase